MLFCHVEFADNGVMVEEDVSLGLGINGCSAVMASLVELVSDVLLRP